MKTSPDTLRGMKNNFQLPNWKFIADFFLFILLHNLDVGFLHAELLKLMLIVPIRDYFQLKIVNRKQFRANRSTFFTETRDSAEIFLEAVYSLIPKRKGENPSRR